MPSAKSSRFRVLVAPLVLLYQFQQTLQIGRPRTKLDTHDASPLRNLGLGNPLQLLAAVHDDIPILVPADGIHHIRLCQQILRVALIRVLAVGGQSFQIDQIGSSLHQVVTFSFRGTEKPPADRLAVRH